MTSSGPPACWALYFPPEAFAPDDRRALLVKEMTAVLGAGPGWGLLRHGARSCLDTYAVDIDYDALRSVTSSPDLQAALDVQPEEGLACLNTAIHEILFSGPRPRATELFGACTVPGRVATRLFNLPHTTINIRQLKSSAIGKLVSIRGTVVRVSRIKPMVTAMSFACAKCSQATGVAFLDGKYAIPIKCSSSGCRGKAFSPIHTSATTTDWQKVRVQEVAGADQSEEGRVPRTVEVELRGDLVDSCAAGDIVTIMALVKVMDTSGAKGGGGRGGGRGGNAGRQQNALFLLYLDAVSVRSERQRGPLARGGGSQQTAPGSSGQQQVFTTIDLRFVIRFTQETEGDQFRHLVHALCPSIFGNEMVKAGLLLALVGGVRKHSNDASKVPIRGDMHVLLVGDPGQGKSQLLQAAAQAAPRGLYVGANTCTAAGLTVSVVRDSVTGDYAFEAGAMVLGDQGTCCIDEFDKMSGDNKALLEAMEQQEVSVAKAGLVANLPARTSVLAAANPVGGHYDRGKTVQENLKMSNAILSRFDLIFILIDRPDEDLDARLSEHVMALHSGAEGRAREAQQRLLHYPQEQAPLLLQGGSEVHQPTRPPLKDRLKVYSQDDQLLPVALVKKYIAYARQFVNPRIGPAAREVLQTFFLELRQNSAAKDSTPVTARQLESLVRLAEARARLELREDVTKEDAEDVVEIMKEAMHDKFADEFGLMDFRRAAGKSSKAEGRRFLGALQRCSERKGEALFSTSELYSVADELELQVPDLTAFIEELNEAGELLKRGGGIYKLSGSSAGDGSNTFSGMRKRRR